MMHSVVKGGWRPTFALAKQNDSEGRKSRIRRSKNERKAMVESFIKKYQESNGGNFPSLNLTHKEVGGSFYTVREIVRDIIQENRVLGPAKFNLEDFNTDQFLEQNPLGSIASGPQPFLDVSSNEHHPTHNKVPDTNGTMLSVSERHYTEAKHQVIDNGHAIDVGHVDVPNKETIEADVVPDEYYSGAEHPVVDNGHVVNGSQVDVTNNEYVEAAVVSDGYFSAAELEIVDKGHITEASQVDLISKESNDATIPEMQVSKPVVPKQNAEQELAATTVPLAKVNVLSKNLIVEIFPLRSVARTSNGIEGSGELRDSDNSLEKDIKKLELEEDKKSELNDIKLANNSSLLDEKFENALENNTLKEISNPRHDTESGNHSTLKEQVSASHQKAITLETNNQSQIEDTAKKNIQDEGLHEVDKYRLDGQLGGNSQRRINATVDRINLESWDGRSKNSAKKEHNPLLALLKAIVNAVGKFLSE
ncbi:hypothetical protein P8452_04252 [Trifolium repens]|nr:hypothetical protein P8452_04252 [Trifolium repens]